MKYCLIKQLLSAAYQENIDVFGLGDEALKKCFANRVEKVVTVDIYLPESIENKHMENE